MHRVRYNVDGHARYLTFSCFQNRPFLRSRRARGWFVDALLAARERWGFSLWAYVIMPDHVHLLLLPQRGADIQGILRSCKQPVTERAKAWLQRHEPDGVRIMVDAQPDGTVAYRFWQRGGGYDRNITTPEEAHEKAIYIHNNPVRAGLVDRPEQWPWSSHRAWQRSGEAPIPIDRETLPPLES